MRKIYKSTLALIALSIFLLTGCSSEKEPSIHSGNDIPRLPTTSVEEKESSENADYDVKDTALVLNVDTENMQVVLKSFTDDEKYILTYTGGCDVQNEYGEIIAMSQIEIGEIVDAYYVNSKNKLTRLYISSEAFEYNRVTAFEYNETDMTCEIKGELYTFDDSLIVMSNGVQIELSDIESVDVLTLKGIDKRLNSIIVTSGHGYINLTNTDYFEGGIIEIGKKMMVVITEDMQIVAPEGTYNVMATYNGQGGFKEVTVKRDSEISLSLTEFQDEAERYGNYSFDIFPSEATLKVDGNVTSHDDFVEMTYGTHKIQVLADGYETYNATIVVDSVYESLTIDLSMQSEADDETENDEDEDDGDETSEAQIRVDSPVDAEVYFDGVYKGVVPVSFKKESGTRVITLRRSGYEAKMYTLEITDDNNDVNIVLPELEKIEE
ncbi:MAG: PEGA domain-containing protein [Lachnospiraceae bacterium]|nr:PEGA domain-containing protein [Lachnospiraceae bacterium]